MRDKTVSDRDLAELRVYPLPSGALFPHTVLPLKVDDPELIRVVEDCIEKDLPLAVWQVEPESMGQGAAEDRSRVATVGRVAIHHALPNGKMDIVVEGLERIRILEELPSEEGPLLVRAARHPLQEPVPADTEQRLATLRAIAFLLCGRHPRASKLVRVTLGRLSCMRELSDVLCSVSFDDSTLRQVLLQQSSVSVRLDQVIDAMAGLLLSGGDFDRPFDVEPEDD